MKKIIALALALIMSLSMGVVALAAEVSVSDKTGLIDAVANAAAGDVINVTGTISIDSAVTLDPAVAITIKTGNLIDPIEVVSGGKLTLGANVTVDGNSESILVNGGELVVDGATIKGKNYDDQCTVGMMAGTITINSGLVTADGTMSPSETSSAIGMLGGTLNINGGTVSTTTTDKNGCAAFAYGGTINVYGGTVTNGNQDPAESNALIAAGSSAVVNVYGGTVDSALAHAVAGSKVNIEGGTVGSVCAKKASAEGDTYVTISGGTIDSVSENGGDVSISGGTFTEDVSEYLVPGAQVTVTTGETNPGKTIVVSNAYPRADYKVKSYDFTTGTKGYKGASYIDEIKINKDNQLVIVLKDNYKLAEDKTIVGEIVLQDKDTKALITVPVEYTVKNKVHETYGETKAKDAIEVPEGENQVILMDEDGGYVYFEEEMLKGVVKMNKEEKTFLNVIYGVDTKTEDTIDAIEEFLGEDYVDEAIIEYYTFETRAFKNDVDFSYEAWEDDPHFFYKWEDGKLTKIDAKYNDDEDVEAWQWTAVAEGTIIVTDVEIVLAAETTKNPDTGASDVVGMASALAVVSLIAVGAISLKK